MVRYLCRSGCRQNFANFYITQQNSVRYEVELLRCCAKIFCVYSTILDKTDGIAGCGFDCLKGRAGLMNS